MSSVLKNWIINIVVITIVLMTVAGYIDSFQLAGVGAAIEASIILSLLNAIVKPILIILTLPVTVLTLGFFLVVINAMTLSLTAQFMGDAFNISNFGTALFASLIISILNMLIQNFIVRPLTKK
ncbi:membrane protein [Pullulanibacillus camelliae]|uniref:Membrane protein n=1 Tax=Pullulanibacillus camelliae TaxID=1707096 RepID=A0A8J2YCD6_9BACL|nr:phage holin family protein [Pullulanibacillus camelliae]GGE36494.1 membrane protein [Pullulanibacillus camelliae]